MWENKNSFWFFNVQMEKIHAFFSTEKKIFMFDNKKIEKPTTYGLLLFVDDFDLSSSFHILWMFGNVYLMIMMNREKCLYVMFWIFENCTIIDFISFDFFIFVWVNIWYNHNIYTILKMIFAKAKSESSRSFEKMFIFEMQFFGQIKLEYFQSKLFDY